MLGRRSRRFVPLALLLALCLGVWPSAALPASAAGRAWSQLGLAGFVVSSVAVHPTNPAILLAGTRGGGVNRSVDGGQHWVAVGTGLANPWINDVQFDPATPTIVYAGTGQSAAMGDPNNTSGIYRSTNLGDTWTRVAPGYVGSIVPVPSNPNVVYAAGAPPVLKSIDHGLTWAAASSGIANTTINSIAIDPVNNQVLLAAGATEGGGGNLYRSTDGGVSWSSVVTAMSGQPAFTAVAFVRGETSNEVAYATAFGNLLRSTNSGATWSTVLTGQSCLSVLINPTNPAEVFVGTAGAGVFRSTDSGVSFVTANTGLGSLVVHALGYDGSAGGTLYAGTDSGVWAFSFQSAPPIQATSTWYFAEGSTQQPFDTWFLIQNSGATPANVRVTFQRPDGSQQLQGYTVGATSRFSIFANEVVPNSPISTKIEADQDIFAERAMYFRFDGTAVTGIAAPAQTWYLAEGSTAQPFQTWILLQNPSDQPASVTLTFQKPDGSTQTLTRAMPPTSRDSVFVNQYLPNTAFSTQVTASQKIIVERAMYLAPNNNPTGGGHGVAGVTAASPSWYFAEGLTVPFMGRSFDTWLLLQNPGQSAVTATIQLMSTTGQVQTISQQIGPTSRASLYLNQFIQGSFGITVQATGPIIAERARYYGSDPYKGADATVGSPVLATTWNLAEGSTAAPFTEIVAILNPSGQPLTAHIDFQLPGGSVVGRDFTVGATSKLAIDVGQVVPNTAVSARITTSAPAVVERSMFFEKGANGGPGPYLGGTNTIGIAR